MLAHRADEDVPRTDSSAAMTDAPPIPTVGIDSPPGAAGFDLLPARPPRDRRPRISRPRVPRPRGRNIGIGAVVAVLVLGGVTAAALSGGDDGSPDRNASTLGAPRRSSDAKSSSGVSPNDPSAALPDPADTAPRDTAPGDPEISDPEVLEPVPEPTPSVEQIMAKIELSETVCDWDASTTTLRAGGTLTSANAGSHRVYLAVVWTGADGTELNGAQDQVALEPGGEALEWELTNGLADAPTGLRCEVTFEVLT